MKINQPYARVNQPYATLTLELALREMFEVQLYKNSARALLSRILNILNLDWLLHARSVRRVYEYQIPDSLRYVPNTIQFAIYTKYQTVCDFTFNLRFILEILRFEPNTRQFEI